jgi:hypothetical protein
MEIKQMIKIIAQGDYWVCENMDTLAPIIEQGVEFLMSDNSTIRIKYGEEIEYERANDRECHEFYNKRGFVFEGDKVDIVKGKMKGESKTISCFFKYVVPNTYGKKYTDYVVFTDDTKTNIANCEINGKRAFMFNGIKVGGRV